MDVYEVGRWRFCPACARRLKEPEYSSEDQDGDSFDYEAPRCSGCNRPWTACPCLKEKAVDKINCPFCEAEIEVPEDTEIVVCPNCVKPIEVNDTPSALRASPPNAEELHLGENGEEK